jgi:hypothetical protein
MPQYGPQILQIQSPLDWRLHGTSAWINALGSGTEGQQAEQRQ